MAGLIDEGDVRRPASFPRLSERYDMSFVAAWYLPSRRRLVKGKPVRVEANVIDLSIAGALLESHTDARIQIGQRVRFELNGFDGVVAVRNIRATPAEEHSWYGVSFVSVSNELEAELFSIVSNFRSSRLEEQWNRAT